MCCRASDYPRLQNGASPAFFFFFFLRIIGYIVVVFDLLIRIKARIASPCTPKQLIKKKN